MANVLGELFRNIAAAIREKTGDTATMKPADFPAKIISIEAGGGGGGGSLPAGLYWLNNYDNLPAPTIYAQHWFTFNGELYASARNGSGGGNTGDIYKYANGAWTKVVTAYTFGSTFTGFFTVEFNGKVHFYGQETAYHYIYDGSSSIVKKADIPNKLDKNGMFVDGGQLKAYSAYDGKVYKWDESSDTWTAEATIGAKYQSWIFYTIDNIAYAWYSKKVYRYNNGTLTELFSTTNNLAYSFHGTLHNGCIYHGTSETYNTGGTPLIEIDVKNFTETKLGKMPPFKSGAGIVSYRNELLFYGGDDSGRASMVAYEVEAT